MNDCDKLAKQSISVTLTSVSSQIKEWVWLSLDKKILETVYCNRLVFITCSSATILSRFDQLLQLNQTRWYKICPEKSLQAKQMTLCNIQILKWHGQTVELISSHSIHQWQAMYSGGLWRQDPFNFQHSTKKELEKKHLYLTSAEKSYYREQVMYDILR